MHHAAGIQYGQGSMPTTQQLQPQYNPTETTVPSTSSNTANLRQWRKKDATTEKQQIHEQQTAENQGPIARVAPHAHNPRPTDQFSRYTQQQYNTPEYGLPYKDLAPTPVKYSEIVEPPVTPYISGVIQKPKEKEYIEMCTMQQTTMKPYQDPMKHAYTNMYPQKESHMYKETNFSPYMYHNYKVPNPNQYPPRQYANESNFPYIPDQQMYMDQRIYHNQRMQRSASIQLQNFRPVPQNYQQNYSYKPTVQNHDPYRMHPYQGYKIPQQLESMPVRNFAPRRVYHEQNFTQRSPNYNPCAQLEYAQHYQNRRQIPAEYLQGYNPVQQMPPELANDSSPKPSLKQFLETWNDDIPEIHDNNKEGRKDAPNLYILGSTEIPTESIQQFIHLQVDKLPENIKGFLTPQESVIRETQPKSVISETKKFLDSQKSVSQDLQEPLTEQNTVIVYNNDEKKHQENNSVIRANKKEDVKISEDENKLLAALSKPSKEVNKEIISNGVVDKMSDFNRKPTNDEKNLITDMNKILEPVEEMLPDKSINKSDHEKTKTKEVVKIIENKIIQEFEKLEDIAQNLSKPTASKEELSLPIFDDKEEIGVEINIPDDNVIEALNLSVDSITEVLNLTENKESDEVKKDALQSDDDAMKEILENLVKSDSSKEQTRDFILSEKKYSSELIEENNNKVNEDVKSLEEDDKIEDILIPEKGDIEVIPKPHVIVEESSPNPLIEEELFPIEDDILPTELSPHDEERLKHEEMERTFDAIEKSLLEVHGEAIPETKTKESESPEPVGNAVIVEGNYVLLQIAGELVEINLINTPGKKLLSVVPITDCAVVTENIVEESLKEQAAEHEELLKEQAAEHEESLKEQAAEHEESLKEQAAEHEESLKEQAAEHEESLKEQAAEQAEELLEPDCSEIVIEESNQIDLEEVILDHAEEVVNEIEINAEIIPSPEPIKNDEDEFLEELLPPEEIVDPDEIEKNKRLIVVLKPEDEITVSKHLKMRRRKIKPSDKSTKRTQSNDKKKIVTKPDLKKEELDTSKALTKEVSQDGTRFVNSKHNFSIISKERKEKTKIKTPARNKRFVSLVEDSLPVKIKTKAELKEQAKPESPKPEVVKVVLPKSSPTPASPAPKSLPSLPKSASKESKSKTLLDPRLRMYRNEKIDKYKEESNKLTLEEYKKKRKQKKDDVEEKKTWERKHADILSSDVSDLVDKWSASKSFECGIGNDEEYSGEISKATLDFLAHKDDPIIKPKEDVKPIDEYKIEYTLRQNEDPRLKPRVRDIPRDPRMHKNIYHDYDQPAGLSVRRKSAQFGNEFDSTRRSRRRSLHADRDLNNFDDERRRQSESRIKDRSNDDVIPNQEEWRDVDGHERSSSTDINLGEITAGENFTEHQMREDLLVGSLEDPRLSKYEAFENLKNAKGILENVEGALAQFEEVINLSHEDASPKTTDVVSPISYEVTQNTENLKKNDSKSTKIEVLKSMLPLDQESPSSPKTLMRNSMPSLLDGNNLDGLPFDDDESDLTQKFPKRRSSVSVRNYENTILSDENKNLKNIIAFQESQTNDKAILSHTNKHHRRRRSVSAQNNGSPILEDKHQNTGNGIPYEILIEAKPVNIKYPKRRNSVAAQYYENENNNSGIDGIPQPHNKKYPKRRNSVAAQFYERIPSHEDTNPGIPSTNGETTQSYNKPDPRRRNSVSAQHYENTNSRDRSPSHDDTNPSIVDETESSQLQSKNYPKRRNSVTAQNFSNGLQTYQDENLKTSDDTLSHQAETTKINKIPKRRYSVVAPNDFNLELRDESLPTSNENTLTSKYPKRRYSVAAQNEENSISSEVVSHEDKRPKNEEIGPNSSECTNNEEGSKDVILNLSNDVATTKATQEDKIEVKEILMIEEEINKDNSESQNAKKEQLPPILEKEMKNRLVCEIEKFRNEEPPVLVMEVAENENSTIEEISKEIVVNQSKQIDDDTESLEEGEILEIHCDQNEVIDIANDIQENVIQPIFDNIEEKPANRAPNLDQITKEIDNIFTSTFAPRRWKQRANFGLHFDLDTLNPFPKERKLTPKPIINLDEISSRLEEKKDGINPNDFNLDVEKKQKAKSIIDLNELLPDDHKKKPETKRRIWRQPIDWESDDSVDATTSTCNDKKSEEVANEVVEKEIVNDDHSSTEASCSSNNSTEKEAVSDNCSDGDKENVGKDQSIQKETVDDYIPCDGVACNSGSDDVENEKATTALKSNDDELVQNNNNASSNDVGEETELVVGDTVLSGTDDDKQIENDNSVGDDNTKVELECSEIQNIKSKMSIKLNLLPKKDDVTKDQTCSKPEDIQKCDKELNVTSVIHYSAKSVVPILEEPPIDVAEEIISCVDDDGDDEDDDEVVPNDIPLSVPSSQLDVGSSDRIGVIRHSNSEEQNPNSNVIVVDEDSSDIVRCLNVDTSGVIKRLHSVPHERTNVETNVIKSVETNSVIRSSCSRPATPTTDAFLAKLDINCAWKKQRSTSLDVDEVRDNKRVRFIDAAPTDMSSVIKERRCSEADIHKLGESKTSKRRSIDDISRKLMNQCEIASKSHQEQEDLKLHIKKTEDLKLFITRVPTEKKPRKRKRFRNLHDGESESEENTDYSVFESKSSTGVPRLIIKRNICENNREHLQPVVRIERDHKLDILAKKKRKN